MKRLGLDNLVAIDSPPSTVRLRDGELVLYRRSHSSVYQCRYKLSDGAWTRQSTGKAVLEHAITRACDIYDQARYRQRLGLAHRTHSVAHIAALTLKELRIKMDASTARTAFHDYASCIERYFVPYFGERQLEELTHIDIREFELWRDRQLKRTPKASTLNNFTSAWNRVIATAVQQCYISERVPVPKLSNKGQKSQPRPAFNKDEIAQLLEFMQQWQQGGRSGSEREMRCLLCDYVEMLLYTGMRHGTEAMNIRWQHLEWHNRDGVRYLRVWVSGKTGGRWLIARHSAVVGRTIRRIRRTARSALLGRLDL